MGHERVGVLPHSKRWRDIVAQIAEFSGTSADVAGLTKSTLQNVHSRYRRLPGDRGVLAAFQFLLALAKSASYGDERRDPNVPDIDLRRNPSALRLVMSLRAWVDAHQESLEYAEIAKKAGADAIGLWTEQQQRRPTLFTQAADSSEVWRRAQTGAAFCEIARLFFAKFTERYLNYFLGREGSASLGTVGERDQLAQKLEQHVDGVSKYAFETSRITQSFAAGWFNRHARDRLPSERELESFLSIAFGKMRDEFMRETLGK